MKSKKTRSQIGRMSRNKGKRAEREAAKVLNDLFGLHCRRGQQRSGRDEQDLVDHIPGLWLEVKMQERLNLRQAMIQADTDRISNKRHNDVPVVLHRSSRSLWMATCYLEDLPALVLYLKSY